MAARIDSLVRARRPGKFQPAGFVDVSVIGCSRLRRKALPRKDSSNRGEDEAA
jgi:hypothetical protein